MEPTEQRQEPSVKVAAISKLTIGRPLITMEELGVGVGQTRKKNFGVPLAFHQKMHVAEV